MPPAPDPAVTDPLKCPCVVSSRPIAPCPPDGCFHFGSKKPPCAHCGQEGYRPGPGRGEAPPKKTREEPQDASELAAGPTPTPELAGELNALRAEHDATRRLLVEAAKDYKAKCDELDALREAAELALGDWANVKMRDQLRAALEKSNG